MRRRPRAPRSRSFSPSRISAAPRGRPALGSASMKIGIPKETFTGEKRVAMDPASIQPLAKAGMQFLVQAGAGAAAGYPDGEYEKRGATIVADRAKVFDAD